MNYGTLVAELRLFETMCRHSGGKGEIALLAKNAADSIENLDDICQHQADEIRELKSQWIPVTERLPEVGKKVLVFAYGHDTLTARMQKQTENGCSVFECNGIFLEMAKPGRITHWMPLPEAPKDGEA